LWGEEEERGMATISSETNHNDEIIASNNNSSTTTPTVTTTIGDEMVDEEDGEEFIPPQTPRVHTSFSSSSSSLVSTGTTSSSGIFGDIKSNTLHSTNSGSLGDFSVVNNARSSFGSNVSIDSGMEEASNASNESDISSIVNQQESAGVSIISPSSSSSTILQVPPNLPQMPLLSSHFRQMCFNNPATFYNVAAARFQNAYLMNVLRHQTPNCWNPYAFGGGGIARAPMRPPFFPQHMNLQDLNDANNRKRKSGEPLEPSNLCSPTNIQGVPPNFPTVNAEEFSRQFASQLANKKQTEEALSTVYQQFMQQRQQQQPSSSIGISNQHNGIPYATSTVPSEHASRTIRIGRKSLKREMYHKKQVLAGAEEDEYDGDSEQKSVQAKHVSEKFCSDEPLVCEWEGCNQTLLGLKNLVEHVVALHIQPQTTYCCKWAKCNRGRPFNAQYMLLLHVRRHTGERPHECFLVCAFNPFHFSIVDISTAHFSTNHFNASVFSRLKINGNNFCIRSLQ
jgi:hypothetical protein